MKERKKRTNRRRRTQKNRNESCALFANSARKHCNSPLPFTEFEWWPVFVDERKRFESRERGFSMEVISAHVSTNFPTAQGNLLKLSILMTWLSGSNDFTRKTVCVVVILGRKKVSFRFLFFSASSLELKIGFLSSNSLVLLFSFPIQNHHKRN